MPKLLRPGLHDGRLTPYAEARRAPCINGCRITLHRPNRYLEFLRNLLCALTLEKKFDGSRTACQDGIARRGYLAWAATIVLASVLPHEGMLPDGLLSFRFLSSLLSWFAGREAPSPRRLSTFLQFTLQSAFRRTGAGCPEPFLSHARRAMP